MELDLWDLLQLWKPILFWEKLNFFFFFVQVLNFIKATEFIMTTCMHHKPIKRWFFLSCMHVCLQLPWTEYHAKHHLIKESDISIFTGALSATLPWACPTSTHQNGRRGNTHCHSSYLPKERRPIHWDNKQIQLQLTLKVEKDRQKWSFCSLRTPGWQ